LNARDNTLVWASRAPQADIVRLKARMSCEMPWYAIAETSTRSIGVNFLLGLLRNQPGKVGLGRAAREKLGQRDLYRLGISTRCSSAAI
jgi:hypothetical protein